MRLEEHEAEITQPVLECTGRGRLNRAAVGWSRRPLHRCNLSGRWPRKKRWEYWCVACDDHLLALTYADIDYLGLAVATFLDLHSARLVEKVAARPLALGFRLGETVGGADTRFEGRGLRLAFLQEPGGVRLSAQLDDRGAGHLDADVFVERPANCDTLNVLVPWGDDLFQFTSKQVALPARGHVSLGGRRFAFGPENHAFACLDFGRGVWPYRTAWNWAAGAGIHGGRAIGLNLGGLWTDGTDATENGVFVDGRLHKVSEDLVFRYDPADLRAPWRIRTRLSRRLDVTFAPFYEREVRLDLALLASELHWTVGRFSGAFLTGEGEEIVFRDLLGWAEEHRARW